MNGNGYRKLNGHSQEALPAAEQDLILSIAISDNGDAERYMNGFVEVFGAARPFMRDPQEVLTEILLANRRDYNSIESGLRKVERRGSEGLYGQETRHVARLLGLAGGRSEDAILHRLPGSYGSRQ